MRHVLIRVRQFAPLADFPVHFEGPTGVGKSILARYLHELSPRKARPFVPVDAGGLDDALASSHLFGHERGAFTGAAAERRGFFVEASGGTLLLDEIGKASLTVQQRLLGVVETQRVTPVGANRAIPFDARVVSASNVPLDTLIADRQFLSDLAARLRGVTIHVPPLAMRREDIADLATRAIAVHASETGYAEPPRVHDELMLALTQAPWPENIRQLQHAIRCLLVFAERAPILRLQHCEDELAYLRSIGRMRRRSASVADVERALRETGSYAGAARILGKSLASVYRLLPATPRLDTPISVAQPRAPDSLRDG